MAKTRTSWTKTTAPKSPGRPVGAVSSKTKALNIIFKIMEEYGDSFEEQMNLLANQNIVAFYLKFVYPFLPKGISESQTPDQKSSAEMEEWLINNP